jgi:hypothetical protein
MLSGKDVIWNEGDAWPVCKNAENWMVVQRPEDVLMLGGWVEQLEAVQTRPSALIWDPSALQRDSSPSKLGGDLVWSSSSQAASEVWGCMCARVLVLSVIVIG